MSITSERPADRSPAEAILVKPKEAARLLGCGITRIYDLIADGSLESLWDGGRKITTQSIRQHVARELEAQARNSEQTPSRTAAATAARMRKRAATNAAAGAGASQKMGAPHHLGPARAARPKGV
jgi:hypothetical protein